MPRGQLSQELAPEDRHSGVHKYYLNYDNVGRSLFVEVVGYIIITIIIIIIKD